MRAAPPNSRARVAICQSETSTNTGAERRERGREENREITLKQRVTQVAKKRLLWRAVSALLTGGGKRRDKMRTDKGKKTEAAD